jgi:hypothetical protein
MSEATSRDGASGSAPSERWTLATPADAKRILDHFNGFHDGFLHAISLRSHDAFRREGPAVTDIAHLLTGTFDVVVEVAHYNYAAGTQPHDRLVRGTFENVRDFHLDLRGAEAHDWPIYEVTIEACEASEGAGTSGPRLAFIVCRRRLVEGEWIPQTDRLFTFERARFEEDVRP